MNNHVFVVIFSLFYHPCTCNLFTMLFFLLCSPLLLPLLPVIAPSFLFPHAPPPPFTSLPFQCSSSCPLFFPLSLSSAHTQTHAHPRWLSWSRSTEPSAGRWSPSTWRGALASSAVNVGTTTWTQRWKRHLGLRRRTGSSTRHMRNWETAGLKLPSCSLAGEAKHKEERKVEKEMRDESLSPCWMACMMKCCSWEGETELKMLNVEWKTKPQRRRKCKYRRRGVRWQDGMVFIWKGLNLIDQNEQNVCNDSSQYH